MRTLPGFGHIFRIAIGISLLGFGVASCDSLDRLLMVDAGYPPEEGSGGRQGGSGGRQAPQQGSGGRQGGFPEVGSGGRQGGFPEVGSGGRQGGFPQDGSGGRQPLHVCPPGEFWCPGCEAGSGACSAQRVCPGVDCDTPCSSVTEHIQCEARSDCHSVFFDQSSCMCAGPGCCARFSMCVDGDQPQCGGTATCLSEPPLCVPPLFAVGHADGCYDGCVYAHECR